MVGVNLGGRGAAVTITQIWRHERRRTHLQNPTPSSRRFGMQRQTPLLILLLLTLSLRQHCRYHGVWNWNVPAEASVDGYNHHHQCRCRGGNGRRRIQYWPIYMRVAKLLRCRLHLHNHHGFRGGGGDSSDRWREGGRSYTVDYCRLWQHWRLRRMSINRRGVGICPSRLISFSL